MVHVSQQYKLVKENPLTLTNVSILIEVNPPAMIFIGFRDLIVVKLNNILKSFKAFRFGLLKFRMYHLLW